MARATSSTMVSGSQLFSYVEADNYQDTANKLYMSVRGGVTSDFDWDMICTSKLLWAENGTQYDLSGSNTAYYDGYGDMQLVSETAQWDRYSYDRNVEVGCYSSCVGGSATAWLYDMIIPHLPNAPTNLTATRASDTRVNISWTAPTRSYDNLLLEVSIDGGAWSQFASLGSATSYAYTAASADHSYSFRARAYYRKAYSSYTSATAAISMTPLPPQSITTAAIQGSTDIAVTLENNSPVATSLVWEVSTDGGSTWSAGSTSPVAGTPVTSFTATGISGTAYIRVANANATGTSAWLVSEAVTTICPPAAPTIVAPAGSIVNIADGSMTIEWLFNSLDGSAQTAYEVSLSKNGGAAVTQSGTTATKLTITFSGLTPNSGDTLTFKVRTKGADANWSDWSSTKTVTLYTPPTVAVTSPSATVTSMPLSIIASYTDAAGTCKAASFYIAGNGQRYPQEGTLPLAITTSGGATTLSASVPVSAFLPANDAQYTVYITARSSSSLQTSANATFTTAFTEPAAGELSITNEPETGYVDLTATYDQAHDIAGEWELGSLNTNNGADVSNTNRARSVSIIGVEVNSKYEISGTGQVNVHYYQGGTWKGNLGAWQNLPYTYDTGAYDGIRFVMRNSDNSDVDVDAIDITYKDVEVHGKNIVSELYSGYVTGSTSTFVKLNSSTNGTIAIAQLEQNTDYTITAKTYTGANRTRLVLLDSNPLDEAQHAAGTFSSLVWQNSFTADLTETFNSGTYTWLILGMSDNSVAYNPDAQVQVEKGIEATEYEPWAQVPIAQSISVSRVNPDGTITPLLEGGSSGSGIVDKYAPLNTPYQYAVTTQASTQAVKTVYVDNLLETDRWFAYWTAKEGENVVEKSAWAKWNPDNGGIQIARPQKTRVYYAGRKDPVSYDGAAVSLNETPSWMIVERSEIQPFVQLIEDGGRGVYKSCDGWVYHADFDLTLTPKYTAIGYYGGIGLTVTRIAGEQL